MTWENETFASIRHAAVVFAGREVRICDGLDLITSYWTEMGVAHHTHTTMPDSLRPAVQSITSQSLAAFRALRAYGVSEQAIEQIAEAAWRYAKAVRQRHHCGWEVTGDEEARQQRADGAIAKALAAMHGAINAVAPGGIQHEEDGEEG